MPLNNITVHQNAEQVGADDERYPTIDAATHAFTEANLYDESPAKSADNAAQGYDLPGLTTNDQRK